MGTKNTPNEFHCYGNAADDEPLFTLRATDPLAPGLIRGWVEMRKVTKPQILSLPPGMTTHEQRKRAEALKYADAMEDWRKENRSKITSEIQYVDAN